MCEPRLCTPSALRTRCRDVRFHDGHDGGCGHRTGIASRLRGIRSPCSPHSQPHGHETTTPCAQCARCPTRRGGLGRKVHPKRQDIRLHEPISEQAQRSEDRRCRGRALPFPGLTVVQKYTSQSTRGAPLTELAFHRPPARLLISPAAAFGLERRARTATARVDLEPVPLSSSISSLGRAGL